MPQPRNTYGMWQSGIDAADSAAILHNRIIWHLGYVLEPIWEDSTFPAYAEALRTAAMQFAADTCGLSATSEDLQIWEASWDAGIQMLYGTAGPANSLLGSDCLDSVSTYALFDLALDSGYINQYEWHLYDRFAKAMYYSATFEAFQDTINVLLTLWRGQEEENKNLTCGTPLAIGQYSCNLYSEAFESRVQPKTKRTLVTDPATMALVGADIMGGLTGMAIYQGLPSGNDGGKSRAEKQYELNMAGAVGAGAGSAGAIGAGVGTASGPLGTLLGGGLGTIIGGLLGGFIYTWLVPKP